VAVLFPIARNAPAAHVDGDVLAFVMVSLGVLVLDASILRLSSFSRHRGCRYVPILGALNLSRSDVRATADAWIRLCCGLSVGLASTSSTAGRCRRTSGARPRPSREPRDTACARNSAYNVGGLPRRICRRFVFHLVLHTFREPIRREPRSPAELFSREDRAGHASTLTFVWRLFSFG